MKRFIVMLAMTMSLALAACTRKTTVDDVVNKMVEANGGAEKLAAIQDQISIWDTQMVLPQGDSMVTMNGGTVITYKRPNKIKFESKGPEGTISFASGFDGVNGWIMMRGQVRDMSPAEIQEITTSAETWIDLFYHYSQKGMKLALLADTTMAGKTYHVIYATDRYNNTSKNFCNAQTGLVERSEYKATDPMSGQKQAYTMTLAGYAPHDSFMMPNQVTNYDASGNMILASTFKEVKNNTGVADDVFAKPAAPMTRENSSVP